MRRVGKVGSGRVPRQPTGTLAACAPRLRSWREKGGTRVVREAWVNPRWTLLPVVHVAPSGVGGIFRMCVTDHCPFHSIDDGVAIAIQIGAHLKSTYRTPFPTLVRALAVQAPQIVRSLGVDEDEIAMRRFHAPAPFLTPVPAGRGCGTESPRSRASAGGPAPPPGRRWCGRS